MRKENLRLIGEYALGIDAGIVLRENIQSDASLDYLEGIDRAVSRGLLLYLQGLTTLGAYIFRSSANSIGKIYEENQRMSLDAPSYVVWGRAVANVVTGVGIDVLRIAGENYLATTATALNHFPILLTLAGLHTVGNAVTGIYNISKGSGRAGI